MGRRRSRQGDRYRLFASSPLPVAGLVVLRRLVAAGPRECTSLSAWARARLELAAAHPLLIRQDRTAAAVLRATRSLGRTKLTVWIGEDLHSRLVEAGGGVLPRAWLAEEVVRVALHALGPASPVYAVAERLGPVSRVLVAAYPEGAARLADRLADEVLHGDPRRLEALLVSRDDPRDDPTEQDHYWYGLTEDEWMALGVAEGPFREGLLREGVTPADLRSLLAAQRSGWTVDRPPPDGLTAVGWLLAFREAEAAVVEQETDLWHAAEELVERLGLEGQAHAVERMRRVLVRAVGVGVSGPGALHLRAMTEWAAGPLRPALLTAWERGDDEDLLAVLRTARLAPPELPGRQR